MLATVPYDTWNVFNMQNITPYSKRWDYSDIPGGGKWPAQMAETDRNPQPTVTNGFPAKQDMDAMIWCFCEARRASHCHSPQTTFSSNSTCCVLSTQKSAMHVVVYADRLTTQHSIVDIVHWSWSYWQFCYPRWHVECFWAALAAHWISSASHTSVLPQHPRRKIVPYRVGWNHHTSDYYG